MTEYKAKTIIYLIKETIDRYRNLIDYPDEYRFGDFGSCAFCQFISSKYRHLGHLNCTDCPNQPNEENIHFVKCLDLKSFPTITEGPHESDIPKYEHRIMVLKAWITAIRMACDPDMEYPVTKYRELQDLVDTPFKE